MKVLQLTERYPPAIGGVETHVKRLSQELSKRGINVQVITTDLSTTDPFTRFLKIRSFSRREDVPVLRVNAFPFLPLKRGLGLVSPGMLAFLNDADVVHAHGYGHFPTYLAWVCRFIGVPFVVTTHSDAGRYSIMKKLFDIVVPRLTIRSAQRVIAVSNHERRLLIQRGVDEKKIAVIPNGVDVGEFSTLVHAEPRDEQRTLLYAGRIDIEQKGLDLLIKALALLRKKKTMKINLKLAGPDFAGSSKRLKDISRKFGVDNGVEFLGLLSREKLLTTMHSSDLFVLPSRFEPFGIVLLEALASKVPIVASRVGAIPEILDNGKFGTLFEPGNETSLAESIELSLSHPEISRQKALKGKDSLARYSWENIAEATARVYEEAKSESRIGISQQPLRGR